MKNRLARRRTSPALRPGCANHPVASDRARCGYLPTKRGKGMYTRAVNPVGLARALEVRVGEWMARSMRETPGNQTTAPSLTNAGSSAAAIAATLHDGL